MFERLLELNHQRYAEEVAQGLHDKKAKGQKLGAIASGAAKPNELETMQQGELF